MNSSALQAAEQPLVSRPLNAGVLIWKELRQVVPAHCLLWVASVGLFGLGLQLGRSADLPAGLSPLLHLKSILVNVLPAIAATISAAILFGHEFESGSLRWMSTLPVRHERVLAIKLLVATLLAVVFCGTAWLVQKLLAPREQVSVTGTELLFAFGFWVQSILVLSASALLWRNTLTGLVTGACLLLGLQWLLSFLLQDFEISGMVDRMGEFRWSGLLSYGALQLAPLAFLWWIFRERWNSGGARPAGFADLWGFRYSPTGLSAYLPTISGLSRATGVQSTTASPTSSLLWLSFWQYPLLRIALCIPVIWWLLDFPRGPSAMASLIDFLPMILAAAVVMGVTCHAGTLSRSRIRFLSDRGVSPLWYQLASYAWPVLLLAGQVALLWLGIKGSEDSSTQFEPHSTSVMASLMLLAFSVGCIATSALRVPLFAIAWGLGVLVAIWFSALPVLGHLGLLGPHPMLDDLWRIYVFDSVTHWILLFISIGLLTIDYCFLSRLFRLDRPGLGIRLALASGLVVVASIVGTFLSVYWSIPSAGGFESNSVIAREATMRLAGDVVTDGLPQAPHPFTLFPEAGFFSGYGDVQRESLDPEDNQNADDLGAKIDHVEKRRIARELLVRLEAYMDTTGSSKVRRSLSDRRQFAITMAGMTVYALDQHDYELAKLALLELGKLRGGLHEYFTGAMLGGLFFGQRPTSYELRDLKEVVAGLGGPDAVRELLRPVYPNQQQARQLVTDMTSVLAESDKAELLMIIGYPVPETQHSTFKNLWPRRLFMRRLAGAIRADSLDRLANASELTLPLKPLVLADFPMNASALDIHYMCRATVLQYLVFEKVIVPYLDELKRSETEQGGHQKSAEPALEEMPGKEPLSGATPSPDGDGSSIDSH